MNRTHFLLLAWGALLFTTQAQAQSELKPPVRFNSTTTLDPASRPVPTPQPSSIGQPPPDSQFSGVGITSGSAGPRSNTAPLFPQAAYLDGQGATVSTYQLKSARVGNSFSVGVPRYYMGDEITPPVAQADGTTLAGANYWRHAPARPDEAFTNPDMSPVTEVVSGDVFGGGKPVATLAADDYEDFYYSPHADRVFASQPGTVTVYWVANSPEGGKYQIKRETFNVSSATQGNVRTIYWTEKSFNSPRVNIPSGRIQGVNPVYSKAFKATVTEGQEYVPPGFVENPDPNARPPKELRTLFYEKTAGLGQIGAYNVTGRIMIEYLGTEIEPGRYEFLGADIVEVARSMTSRNVTTELGEQVLPEDGDASLAPSPVQDLSQGGLAFYGTRPLTNGKILYDAERENLNPDNVIFYWLSARDAEIHLQPEAPGLSIFWPKYQNRYLFVWPDNLGRFAHVNTGVVGSSDATGLQFGTGDVPEVIFQDDGALTESKFTVDTQRLITGLTADGDGFNRSLLKFTKGSDVWYVRLYTQAEDRAGYQEGDGAPAINTTAVVGTRIERPSDDHAVAGYISGGTGYQASAYRDPYALGVETAATGAIIPVNALPTDNALTVRWFEKVEPDPPNPAFAAFYVPSKVGRYTVSYPQALGNWQPVAAMGEERYFHTSTLLADGRVLVTGGYSWVNGALSSAELYDPTTGTWRLTQTPMNVGRWGHTATLLNDGKVLVTGSNTNSAEIFDPATESWTLISSMSAGRTVHAATLLADGRVLVAGGYLNATAEIYDHAAGTWTPTGGLSENRARHTATLMPGGKVLAAGGGYAGQTATATAEVYDPATGTWTVTTAPMSAARGEATGTLLADGKILMAGGYTNSPVTGLFGGGTTLATVAGNPNPFFYDGAASAWEVYGLEAVATSQLESPLLTVASDGPVVLSFQHDYQFEDSFDGGRVLVSVNGGAYVPVSFTDQTTTAQAFGGAAAWSGTVAGVSSSATLFTGYAGSTFRFRFEAGWDGSVKRADPNWKITNIAVTNTGHVTHPNLATSEIYDPADGSWTATSGPLAAARSNHTAHLMPDGRVLVTGNSCELFDPEAGTWSAAAPLAAGRSYHSSTLLANGQVLVAGGSGSGGLQKSAELLDAVSQIVMASNQGTADLTVAQAAGSIYQENDHSKVGFNPNEEHAVKFDGKFYALRDDLNVTSGDDYTSEGYILVAYTNPADGRPSIRPFKVLREDTRYKFSYRWLAGTKIQGPQPLPSMGIPAKADGSVANTEVYISGDTAAGSGAPATYDSFTLEDRQGYKWVYRGTHAGGDHQFGMRWYYPMKTEFFIPGTSSPPAVNSPLPYLRPIANGVPVGHPVSGNALTVAYTPTWPEHPPEMSVAQTLTLTNFGLPDVRNQKSAEVYYQQSIANQGTGSNSVILHDPTVYKKVPLGNFLTKLPAKIRTSTLSGKQYFQGLPPHLQTRFYLDPLASAKGTLVLKGEFHDVIGEDYLDLNVLSAEDELALKALAKDDPSEQNWSLAIEALTTSLDTYKENPSQRGTFIVDAAKHRDIGRNDLVDIRYSDTPRDSYALTATGRGEGYVTLVLGNGRNPGQTPPGDPPVVQIVKVTPKLYTGDLKVMLSDNPLDEKVSLRHSGDFAAKPEDYEFEWRYASATDDPQVYQYTKQKWLGDVTQPNTTMWQQKRNPESDLPHDFSVNLVALPEQVVIKDDSYNLSSGLPGLVFKSRNRVDFSSGIPSNLIFSADLPALDGFVLYINGVEALAYNAPASFTNSAAASDLSASGLSKQFSLDGGFFSKGFNEIIVALYTSADQGATSNIDFRLEGSTKVDQVTLPGSPWQEPGGTLSNIIATGGSPTAPLGSPILVMQDNFFTMRYRPKINVGNILAPGTDQDAVSWSDWADRANVEGWIKRVLAKINPFNQRMSDLQNNAVNTDVSLLTQAGAKWEGDIALTLDALNGYGLIEIYETVLNRGKQISIDAGYDKPGVNDALLLAAGYLHDLYTILGNEAYADAANPTISIDDQTTVTEVNTSRYSFENQVASVLDEELVLLRGRDDFTDPKVTQSPYYNRLFWNFTRGIDAGEVLYAVNYNIKEKAGSSTADGNIDAADAQRMFPQGHGDAYGHYLTALKGYYRLLTNPNFSWVPRSEFLNILGQTVAVDYQDERKFAEAAANVARTAEQIVTLTHRQQYHDDPADGWAHFRDGDLHEGRYNTRTDNTRRWGLDDWISRAGQGSYYHWAVGNAMLPDADTLHESGSIQRIDRSSDSVPNLSLLTFAADSFQTTLDNANAHLNPLGLSPGAIAFDISPAELKSGVSHYEQVYGRALGAALNAKGAFDQAAKMTRLLRNQENQTDDFNTAVQDEERAFNYKMIDIYGTPYPGDMGPGKTFSQDYNGPDDVNYFVVDRPSGLLDTSNPVDITARQQINIQNFSGYTLEVATNSLPKEYNHYTFTIQPDQFVMFADQWSHGVDIGKRSVTGRLQQALTTTQLAYIAMQAGNARLKDTYLRFDLKTKLLQEVLKSQATAKSDTEDSKALQTKYAIAAAAATVVSEVAKAAKDKFTETGITLTEFFPKANGFSNDMTSGFRGGIKTATSIGGYIALGVSVLAKGSALALTNLKEKEQRDLVATLTALGVTRENQQLAYEYEVQYQEMVNQLYEIAELSLQLQRSAEEVRNVLAQGDRLQLERKLQRQRAATVVQGYRVRDLTFRTFRNEGLEQYRTLFDLASRYTYLAAKSYDYETGLLGTADGQKVIASIVSARALGDLTNAVPQSTVSTLGDAGLAGTMAQLQADFSVAKGRLGINNPDQNGTVFSMRHELYRILNDPAITSDDEAWQQTLEQHIKPDIMVDPDVATYCRNIKKNDGSAIPGIIIPFSTTIQHEKNFFGLDYAAGDHKYSPSNYATKIYSVGIVLPGYVGMDPYAIGTPNAGGPNSSDPNALGSTPYVYLIPCGNDYMLAPPLGDTGEIRSWKVQDQALPLPFNIGGTSFNSTQFFNANGTLSEQPWILRKHQAFRPVDDAAFFYSLIPQEYTSSRLIGRSVWNGQWKLVIPAYSLLMAEQDGLDRFVRSVKDIQVFLRTYSNSGN